MSPESKPVSISDLPPSGVKARILVLFRKIGLDWAILYTILERAWSSVASLVSIFFITRFFTIDEQGYYYTFNSLIGMQVFFELGLTFVILQTAAHERARLEWGADGLLQGDVRARARLASLLRLIMKWYGTISALFFLAVVPAGIHFFTLKVQSGTPITWMAPWIWLVAVSSGLLLISPVLAFMEGCGLVMEVAQVRLLQVILGMLLFWAFLAGHMKLYAVPVLGMGNLLVGMAWVLYKKRAFLLDIWHEYRHSDTIDWWREVWPFQWRIGLSWLSGYFIFQLFTPVLFLYHGPASAAKMGLSITIVGAISTVALAWLTTKSPTFGRLAALGKISELDAHFFRAMWQAFGVAASSALLVMVGVIFVHHHGGRLSERLLDPLPFALLAGATLVQVIVSAEAIYIRAFKEERFLLVSLCSGSLIGLSTYIFGRLFGATGMMAGYLGVNLLVGLGGGTMVLMRKRKQLGAEPKYDS